MPGNPADMQEAAGPWGAEAHPPETRTTVLGRRLEITRGLHLGWVNKGETHPQEQVGTLIPKRSGEATFTWTSAHSSKPTAYQMFRS